MTESPILAWHSCIFMFEYIQTWVIAQAFGVSRGKSRTTATSKMEHFVIKVNGFLDPTLISSNFSTIRLLMQVLCKTGAYSNKNFYIYDILYNIWYLTKILWYLVTCKVE